MRAARCLAIGAALFAAALAAVILSAGANAASSKPYSIVICSVDSSGNPLTATGQNCSAGNPAVLAPGSSSDSLTVTFKNENKLGSGIQLGSDNLNVPSAPAGFGVTGVFVPNTSPPASVPQCPASFNNSAPVCVVFSNPNPAGGFRTIGFRNLNLSPGQSIQFDLTAVTPQPSVTDCTTTSPCSWSDEAKQSNDFSGTGNDLNSSSNSAYGTVMSAVASCVQQQGCTTTLANGGTATSAPGSISTTVKTSSGTTTVTQLESIDFGAPLDPSKCSGVSSPHLTYENLSNGADNGFDRSQTITIRTRDFSGYVAQACLETKTQFTQLVIASNGKESLAPANPTTLPDGTPGFQGLLANCSSSSAPPPQVNCSKNPGVFLRQANTDGTHTLVADIPPRFDMRIGN